MDVVWGEFFKAETKTSGSKLFTQGKIRLVNATDTAIQASSPASPPVHVRFISEHIGSEKFTASCTCSAAKKNKFCKHFWATLLCVEQKYPDFLSSKRSIEMSHIAHRSRPEPNNSFREEAKLRATAHRKEQYQKQKLRAKLFRGKHRQAKISDERIFPAAVAAALAYFSQNGFSMLPSPTGSALGEAKRKLSRVLHPDKGGSHDEMVELNKNYEVLLEFLRETAV